MTMFLRLLLLSLLIGLVPSFVSAQPKFYWSDIQKNALGRANLDGTGNSYVFLQKTKTPEYIAIHPTSGKMYWVETSFNFYGILRANLDGSNVEVVIDFGTSRYPIDLAIDTTANKLYWLETDTSSFSERIRRANLDGTNEEALISGLSAVSMSIDVDPSAGKIYFGSEDDLRRANLDGTNQEIIITNISTILYSITIDAAGGKVYWSELDRIKRANLDGTNVETIYTATPGLIQPRRLALSTTLGKLYWSEYFTGRIRRANLDGTSVEDVVNEPTQVKKGLAVDNSGAKLYWTQDAASASVTSKVKRSNLDGSTIETLVVDGLQNTVGEIAVHPTAGTVYWIDSSVNPSLLKANTDGTSIQEVIPSELKRPYSVRVDPTQLKIYWCDVERNALRRSNYDGTSLETLVSQSGCSDLALDLTNSRLYWLDRHGKRIRRSNLAGASIENIVTSGITDGLSLDVDVSGGKVYWTDSVELTIKRANIDGSNQQTILSGLSTYVQTVQVDSASAKIYYQFDDDISLRRVNLDGSNNEVVSSFTGFARGFTIDFATSKVYFFRTLQLGLDIFYTLSRMNIDGSALETVTNNFAGFIHIGFDSAANKVFFPGDFNYTIQQAPLNGGTKSTVVSGLALSNVILDALSGKLYLTEGTRILRANLDGSGLQTLISGLQGPNGLALDLTQSHLYWSDATAGKIQRAKLSDGSGVTDILTGLTGPGNLVLEWIGNLIIMNG